MIVGRDSDIVYAHIVSKLELAELVAPLTVTDCAGFLTAPRDNDTAGDINRAALAAVTYIGIEKVEKVSPLFESCRVADNIGTILCTAANSCDSDKIAAYRIAAAGDTCAAVGICLDSTAIDDEIPLDK